MNIIKATSYNQSYVYDMIHNMRYSTYEIFIPEPYNLIIIYGDMYSYEQDKISEIIPSLKPNLEYSNNTKDSKGNIINSKFFMAKNVNEITIEKEFAYKCLEYSNANEKRKKLLEELNTYKKPT
jgi:hypothetical protein